ncbi:MAG TPA: hypothetical protein VFT74_13845, partial [Isosphaeraceae bacterium]|nr:hypothetical protein [Isosphaeraceae bacterium]
MRGMTPAERAAYVASHPRLGDRLQKSMNGLSGNWNSFTVFEKNIAPFAIFYSFQRYAILWTLYHFPLDHPVVATALALAGEVNAQELKKLAAEHGGVPSVIDYTKPVVNGNVLPSGSRFSPILSAPLQAGLEGKPEHLLSALPPPIIIPLEAATGKNFFTGRELGENGWLYMLRQGGNLSPLSRFLGLPDLGQQKSPGAQLFEQQDPLRTERSFITPTIGQSGEQYGKEKELEKLFSTKYGEGKIPGPFDSKLVQELLYGNNGKPKPEMLPEVLKKIHEQEAASATIKKYEAPFLPPSGEFTELQKKLLEAIENAWQTGPNAKPKEESGGQYSSGAGQYSSGPGQYSSGPGQYSSGPGQYGG